MVGIDQTGHLPRCNPATAPTVCLLLSQVKQHGNEIGEARSEDELSTPAFDSTGRAREPFDLNTTSHNMVMCILVNYGSL